MIENCRLIRRDSTVHFGRVSGRGMFYHDSGIAMLVITLALQPLLRADATITDVLEKVYAFEDDKGNDVIGLHLAHKTVHLVDYD